MKVLIPAVLACLGALILGLLVWRQCDHRSDMAEIDRLRALQPAVPRLFSNDMVAGLPEPAQRYFRYTIAEGTPLFTVAEIAMTGQFSIGTKDAPDYMDMQADQVLAAPDGFIWKMSAGSGLMRMSGSDAGDWTRFWLAGLVPVARTGGSADHARSAFGRYASEAVIWTPATLLPGPAITWEPVSDNVARVTFRRGDLVQPVDITVASDGRPTDVVFARWSNANPERIYRLQPFGGALSEFRAFQGFRLPTHVEAGNLYGTPDYFPFFIADVTAVRFVPPAPER